MDSAIDVTRFILALLELPRVGRKTAHAFLRQALPDDATPEALAEFVRDSRSVGLTRSLSVNERDAEAAFEAADAVMDRVERDAIRVLSTRDEAFPARLRSIPDAPVVLFVRGSVEAVADAKSIAIIGTREPTPFGKKAAHRCAQRAAECGLVVVSGLAIGCDTLAHRGCLEGSGRTVAVLAHGLDQVHPASNRKLADEIGGTGGALVSEYAPGTPPRRNYFVERDRLQAGLSAGVLVIETDVDGGTMHTVRFAQEQRRLLACIDHPPEHADAPKAQGNRQLIGDGTAQPIRTAEDLIGFVDAIRSGDPREMARSANPAPPQSQDDRTLFD